MRSRSAGSVIEASSKVGLLEIGTWIMAQPPGLKMRNSSRIARRSSCTCSRTWLHRMTSNDASAISILVMSSETVACGLSRSADTISIFRAARRSWVSAGSGATWRIRFGRPSSRSVRVRRKSQARRSRGWDRQFSQIRPRYEVRLFRTRGGDAEEPIPEMGATCAAIVHLTRCAWTPRTGRKTRCSIGSAGSSPSLPATVVTAIRTWRPSGGSMAGAPTFPSAPSSVLRPPSSFPPARCREAGWFDLVPAYRLATFRTAVALLTVVFHVPKFNVFIHDYTASAFHVPPAFAWLPVPGPVLGGLLAGLQYLAAAGLLLGVGAGTSAWFLAVAGFYVMLLDPEHYSHNAHFHLTLLALIGCSGDRISLPRLIGGGDADARCPAWPERLVRVQVAIVFFYAALDKVLSPFWGFSGQRLLALQMAEHGLGLNWIQRLNQAATHTAPAALSVATIAVEFFLAAAALLRSLW